MSKAMTIDLGGGNYLTTGNACTGIHFEDGSENHFDLDMLGAVSEWLAVAWERVAGEEYRPVIITERGYVADAGKFEPGTVFEERGGEPYPRVKMAVSLPDPSFIDMMSDPGPGTESWGREHVLERDCE